MKDFSKALNYAFLLLRFRARSQHEIRSRLKKRKTPSSVIGKVIKHLKKYNYLDDQEFVDSYIKASLTKGWGPIRVDYNLKKLGISGVLRKQAVDKVENQSGRLISQLLNEKVNSLRNNKPDLDKRKLREKTIRFLANRGFRYKNIFKYLNIYFKKDENR